MVTTGRLALAGLALVGLGIWYLLADGTEDRDPLTLDDRAVASAVETPATHGDDEREPDGWWVKLRPQPAGSQLTPLEAEQLEQLRSIGYVQGSVVDERKGVVRYRVDRATAGLNFYSSGHGPEALLMDMQGNVLHRWHVTYQEAFSDQPPERARKRHDRWWRRARLLEDGSVLAIFEGLGIVKLDRDSRVLWARANQAHHDMWVLPSGEIYVLTREAKMLDGPDGTVPILEDFLTLLDASGNEKRRLSILEAIKTSNPEFLEQGKRRRGDISHTNTLHVLGPNSAGPAFAPGNVLTSMNALGVIAVLDVEQGRLGWSRKTPAQGQHDPKLLDNGNILFFDNREEAGASAVLEIDPATDRVEWQYVGSPEEPFYSEFCGAATRLDSGNTLITESEGGRAFEVTPAGEIVWEFFNPHRAGEQGEYIAVISEMRRLPLDATSSWRSDGAAP